MVNNNRRTILKSAAAGAALPLPFTNVKAVENDDQLRRSSASLVELTVEPEVKPDSKPTSVGCSPLPNYTINKDTAFITYPKTSSVADKQNVIASPTRLEGFDTETKIELDSLPVGGRPSSQRTMAISSEIPPVHISKKSNRVEVSMDNSSVSIGPGEKGETKVQTPVSRGNVKGRSDLRLNVIVKNRDISTILAHEDRVLLPDNEDTDEFISSLRKTNERFIDARVYESPPATALKFESKGVM